MLARFPADDTVFTDEWVTGQDGNYETVHGVEVVYVDGVGWMAAVPSLIGDLATCVWCMSLWIAAAVTVLVWLLLPDLLGHPVWWVMLPFGLSMFTGLVHRE